MTSENEVRLGPCGQSFPAEGRKFAVVMLAFALPIGANAWYLTVTNFHLLRDPTTTLFQRLITLAVAGLAVVLLLLSAACVMLLLIGRRKRPGAHADASGLHGAPVGPKMLPWSAVARLDTRPVGPAEEWVIAQINGPDGTTDSCLLGSIPADQPDIVRRLELLRRQSR